jgi:hypothetical protein
MASPSASLLLSFLAMAWLFLAAVAANEESPTAYEVLASYGFPDGLLPRIVENSGEDYSLDDNGAFKLRLEKICKFTFPNSYEVRYSSRITGLISQDKLRNLSGISVHILYVWWNIDVITVNGDNLVFQVGPFSASFAANNFDDNPMCLNESDE